MFSVFDWSNNAAPIASTFALSLNPPVPSVVIMSSLSTSSSTPFLSSSGHSSDGSVARHVGGNGTPPEPGITAAMALSLEVDETSDKVPSVWDLPHVRKNQGLSKAEQT